MLINSTLIARTNRLWSWSSCLSSKHTVSSDWPTNTESSFKSINFVNNEPPPKGRQLFHPVVCIYQVLLEGSEKYNCVIL